MLEPSGILPPGQLEMLLATKPPAQAATYPAPPVDWVSEGAWAWVQALSSVPALSHVAREIESVSDRWNHWVHHATPEAVDPPGENPTPYTHPTPCAFATTHCTLHTTPYTLHATPNTLHPTPLLLHTTHYTLHTTHYTLFPQPRTLHPT